MTEMSLSDVVSDGAGQGGRRRSHRAAAKRRKRRRRRAWVTVLISMVVVAVAVYAAWAGLRPLLASFNEPDDFAGPGTGAVTVKIPDGASGAAIGGVLKDAGVVKTGKAFVDAYSDNPAAAGIQPGTYRLKLEMTGAGAVEALLDPQARLLSRVTIREGLRLTTILDELAKSTGIPREQFVKAAQDAEGIGLPPSAEGKAEGYLFPATYDIEPGETAAEILTKMVERGNDARREAGIPEASERRLMTLASMVQAESGSEADMGKIARVFANRLKVGQKLESDATVAFAFNSFAVFTTDAQRAAPRPYNTYLYKGLPPGPICSPGLEALRAAMAPPPGKWFYFVTVNLKTGETRFAETFAAHQANNRLLQAWLRDNPGNG